VRALLEDSVEVNSGRRGWNAVARWEVRAREEEGLARARDMYSKAALMAGSEA
jgi:hypothetical protein